MTKNLVSPIEANPELLLHYNTSDSYVGPLVGISERHRVLKGFNHTISFNYPADKDTILKHIDRSNYSDCGEHAIRYVFFEDTTDTDVYWTRGMVAIYVHAGTPQEAVDKLEEFRELFPASKIENANQVQMSFWTNSAHGPTRLNRKLVVPEWDDISNNYHSETSEQLSTIMDKDYRPGMGGKLLLWQGIPGTGKTTAIRALSRSWKDWARLNYITDPEKFFGSNADYMFQVITEGTHDTGEWQSNPDNADKTANWNLLILEDCGEILAPEARTYAGQGLSRFLNCVDGLIGQGLNIIVLVTTNEELGKLHPAVQRPGRTASRIEFKSLDKEHASDWLGSPVDKAMTIAELYAEKEGFENKGDDKGLVGFVN